MSRSKTKSDAVAVAGALAALVIWGCGNHAPLEDTTPLEGRLLNKLGVELYAEGKLADSEAAFLSATASFSVVDDLRGRAESVYNLGVVHRDLSRFREAHEEIASAREIFRELGDRDAEARAMAAQGSVYLREGRWQEAAAIFERAVQSAMGPALAEALAGQAAAFAKAGELSKAREALQRALPAATEEAVRADVLLQLGQLEVVDGGSSPDIAAARATLLEARDIDQRLGRRRPLAAALKLLGRLEEEAGRPEDSAGYYARSVAVSGQPSEPPTGAAAANSTGNAN